MEEMRGPVTKLYQFLENELLRRLQYLPVVIKEERISIAHISFAYDNKEMIELLLKRGALIVKGKFSKLAEINKKIDDLIAKDKDKLERPVTAFVTFDTQEAFERAVFYFPHPQDEENHEFGFVDPVKEEDKHILEEKLKVRRATEPGNILWENRHTTGKEIFLRSIGVGIVILIVLALSLTLFTILMATTTTNQQKYPPAL